MTQASETFSDVGKFLTPGRKAAWVHALEDFDKNK